MPRSHHFHLDMGEHSVTVRTGQVRGEIELLVDGKVVGYQRPHTRRYGAAREFAAELPGEPPQPFRVILGGPGDTGEEPGCVLEIGGRRLPMPSVPAEHPERPPGAVMWAYLRRRIGRLLRRLPARRARSR
ncbi:hypothetical protein [Microtetraspora niveoalba]|uniref:hypothetical protein n=1 Tax=Microtetraspora niveoalba TaxID=46175 RepID=UPI000835E3BB|nr:hypothetical protein [Microtetraspora niveoalba]